MWWIVAIGAIGVGASLVEKWMKQRVKLEEIRALSTKDELALEKQRYENFLLETEKMRLELDYKRQALSHTADPILNELEKEKA